jgi:ABC-2 type transport system ATP-binding protein
MRKSLSVLERGDAPVVAARGLVKRYGRTTALDGLDLEVAAGEVHGFLGPNGAGKSTTIRALLGQIRLDGGELTVFGDDPRSDAVRIHDRLAYVPGDTALWPLLTGGECLDLLGRLGGHQDRRRRDELVQRFELDPTKRTRSYSKGNRQKVALVAALAADVALLVLDEPTSGLDPLMEAEFQGAVREAAQAGRTVLLSSHILDEVEALCDRVTIIRAGATVSTGTLDELRRNTRSTIETVTADPLPAEIVEATGVADAHGTPHAHGTKTTLVVLPQALARVTAAVAARDPLALTVRPPSLDELFLEHYRADPRADSSTESPGDRRRERQARPRVSVR